MLQDEVQYEASQSQGDWLKYQQQALGKFERDQEEIRKASYELLEHLTSIHATIVGISIGLRGLVRSPVSSILVIAWAIQIAAVVLGVIMLRLQTYHDQYASQARFCFSYDAAELSRMRDEGKIDLQRFRGLMVAAMMAQQLVAEGRIEGFWTLEAKQLAKKFMGELPSAKLFKSNKEGKVSRWFRSHRHWEMRLFYGTSFLAFIMLFVAVTRI